MNNLLYHYNLCSMVAQCLCGNCFLYSVEYEIVLNYFTSVYFLIGCSFKLNLEDLVCFISCSLIFIILYKGGEEVWSRRHATWSLFL